MTRAALSLLMSLRLGNFSHKGFCLKNIGTDLGCNYLVSRIQNRMDCSSLNHHLFSKNIIDSPLCICGRPETTKHYLFDCNRFYNLPQKMMQSISHQCEPTMNALLYGATDLIYLFIYLFIYFFFFWGGVGVAVEVKLEDFISEIV